MHVLIRLCVIFSFALSCNLVTSLATAKAIEVKSENFVFVGNVREKDAKSLVLELEKYRSAILQLFGGDAFPEPVPVRIYSARNEKILKEMTGMTNIGGVYLSTLDGPIFILNAKNGFSRGQQARKIALHEYTHHLLAMYSNNFYPRWYNEGLADYFSTFKMNKKGQLIVGRPNQSYAYTLAQKNWMPTEIVVNSIRNYPFKSRGNKSGGLGSSDYFYAQSWLAVHYLQSTKGEAKNLKKYIQLLNANRSAESTFNESFGRTPQEFHKQLRAYYNKNKFQIVRMNPNYDVNVKPLRVTRLDNGLAEFHKAEAMRFFSGAKIKTASIEAQYNKASAALAASGRKRAEILAAQADLASWDNNYVKAQDLITQALTISPKSAIVNRTAGMLYVYKNEAKDVTPRQADMKLARRHLKKAMLKNPDDMATHYQYAKTYVLVSDSPSAQALASAETALDYYRSINFVESNLAMARVLVQGKKYELADDAVNKALIWSSSMWGKANARTLRKILDQQQKY